MKIIYNRLIPFGNFTAINLFGIVFARRGCGMSRTVCNHEKIHTAQMRELLYIPFYIIYLLEWLWRLPFRRGAAYRSLTFEREAYAHQHDMNYLQHRKCFAMWRK